MIDTLNDFSKYYEYFPTLALIAIVTLLIILFSPIADNKSSFLNKKFYTLIFLVLGNLVLFFYWNSEHNTPYYITDKREKMRIEDIVSVAKSFSYNYYEITLINGTTSNLRIQDTYLESKSGRRLYGKDAFDALDYK